MKKLWIILAASCLGLSVKAAPPSIPALNWEKRSDWVSVKTDVTPPAIGDGQADDTAAIQKALAGLKNGATLYLPAGTYRITKTLSISPTVRLLGVTIIGHGRDTRLVWDGPPGGPMILDDGLSNSRYVGLLLDGKGKATVGLYHHSGPGHFETEVGHRHMAFLNFTDTGFLTDKEPATAETMTENCLFENCKRGIAFLAFNDYDYTIDGCEFRQCETAIECRHGNAYVRNCHFEGSTGTDVLLGPEHGTSVRRCTSFGSRKFIEYINCVAPLTIQDCQVAGWTSPEGAITLNGLLHEAEDLSAAPVLMFDCVFTNPPSTNAPVKIMRSGQRLFVSQNVSAKTGGILQPGNQEKVYVIPAGKRKGTLTSAKQSFLKEKVSVPTFVFDAKRDFGAKGDRVTDDTAAIQKTIDAARAKGKGALAYLPTGIYVVKQTLTVTGADYSIGGTGFCSGLYWLGAEGGTMLAVTDPKHITLANLNVGSHDVAAPMNNAIDILQTDSGKPSSAIYDGVTVFGMYDKLPFKKGLWLRGLGKDTVVSLPHVEGNVHLVDAAQADILVENSYEGSVVVEGKDKRRGGLQGFLTHLGTSCTHALYVKDNQSVVASDFYVEQADNGFSFDGTADDPPGRITISDPKMHLNPGSPGNIPVAIRSYGGEIFIGPEQYYLEPAVMKFIQTGTRPVAVFLWASCWYPPTLEVQKETAQVFLVGNAGVSSKLKAFPVEDKIAANTLDQLVQALDDFRALGELDVRLNHPKP